MPASGYIASLIGLYLGERDKDGYLVVPCVSPRIVLEICRRANYQDVHTWERLRRLMFSDLPADELPSGAWDTALDAFHTWEHWKRPRAREAA